MKYRTHYFKNMFLTMTFATFSVLTIALLLLFVQFTKASQESTSKMTIQFMKNAAETISYKTENARNNMLTLLTSNSGVTLLSKKQPQDTEELVAMRNIDHFVSQDTNIFSVYFYNGYRDQIYIAGSDLLTSSEEDFFDKECLGKLHQLDYSPYTPIQRTIPASNYNPKTEDVYTYIFVDSLEDTIDNAVILNISLDKVFNILQGKKDSSGLRNEYLVFSEEDTLLYSTTNGMKEPDMYQTVLTLAKEQDYPSYFTLGEDSFWASQWVDTQTGWRYVSLLPKRVLGESFHVFQITFAFILVGAVLIGLILNFGLSHLLYLPICNLSKQIKLFSKDSTMGTSKNELDMLSDTITAATLTLDNLFEYKESSLSLTRPSFLRTAIEQNIFSDLAFWEQCAKKEIPFVAENPLHLLYIGWYPSDDNQIICVNDDVTLIHSAILNVTYELLSDTFHTQHYFDKNNFIVFVCSGKEVNAQISQSILQTLQLAFHEHFHLDLICLTSVPVSKPHKLQSAFEPLQVAMVRLCFLQQRCILGAVDLVAKSLKDSLCPTIPFDVLEQHIRNGALEQAIGCIDEYFNEFHNYSYDAIYASLGVFAVEFIHMVERIEMSGLLYLNCNYNELYVKIIRSVTLVQARQAIVFLLEQLTSHSELNRDAILVRIVENLMEYIGENYADFNLSSKWMAEENHLTVINLNRVFKIKTGLSASSYIKSIRMQKSKDLLMSTSLPVENIARKVGFENAKYYYSLFKKEYGVSPSTYRVINSAKLSKV